MRIQDERLYELTIALEDAINLLDDGGELLLAGSESTEYLREIFSALSELTAFRAAYPTDRFVMLMSDQYGTRGEQ